MPVMEASNENSKYRSNEETVPPHSDDNEVQADNNDIEKEKSLQLPGKILNDFGVRSRNIT